MLRSVLRPRLARLGHVDEPVRLRVGDRAADGTPDACGWVTDRFGLSWQIVPKRLMELQADPDPARAQRTVDAMMKMVKLDVAELERAADAND